MKNQLYDALFDYGIKRALARFVYKHFVRNHITVEAWKDIISRTPVFEIKIYGEPMRRINYSEIEMLLGPTE